MLAPLGATEVTAEKTGRATTGVASTGETTTSFCPPLTVLQGLSCPLDKALVSPFSCRAPGLSKGLFVGVLLGMHLVVQKVLCQFLAIVNLQLHIDWIRETLLDIY